MGIFAVLGRSGTALTYKSVRLAPQLTVPYFEPFDGAVV